MYIYFDELFTDCFKSNKHKIKIIGKNVVTSNPIFKLPPAKSENIPTIDGPIEPPKSPANAKNANIAVPPVGHFCAEILRVPGHIMPTESPHNAHAINPKIATGAKEAVK